MTFHLQIEAFSVDGRLLHEFEDEEVLTSVCSVVQYHPYLPVLVGGNSSGYVFVFMWNFKDMSLKICGQQQFNGIKMNCFLWRNQSLELFLNKLIIDISWTFFFSTYTHTCSSTHACGHKHINVFFKKYTFILNNKVSI